MFYLSSIQVSNIEEPYHVKLFQQNIGIRFQELQVRNTVDCQVFRFQLFLFSQSFVIHWNSTPDALTCHSKKTQMLLTTVTIFHSAISVNKHGYVENSHGMTISREIKPSFRTPNKIKSLFDCIFKSIHQLNILA